MNQQVNQDRRNNARRQEDRPEPESDGTRLGRVIDFRVPLYWLLSSAGGLLWALISMYFALQSVTRELSDIKLSLKVNDAASIAAAADLALLKYRLAAIESELSGLKGAQAQSAQQQAQQGRR